MKMRLSSVMLFSLALLLPADMLSMAHARSEQEDYDRASRVFDGHQDEFDYIIVGFGSAGAILARKLSDNKKHSVLVIEAGQNEMDSEEVLDPNPLGAAEDLTYNPLYAATYPVPLGAFAATLYSAGRTWGGSAAHNGMIYVRGVPSDWDTMAANSGDNRWLYSNVLPFMKAIETYTPNGTVANPTQRGFSGPIDVTQLDPIDGTNNFAAAMAAVTGSVFVSDYNNALLPNNSISATQLTVTAEMDSVRSFSGSEFMPVGEVMDEKGRGLHGRQVRVLSNAVATRLLFDESHHTHVTGVQYLRNKPSKKSERIKKVYARKKVILCAGAIESPKLLMLSGIGDRAMLEDLGIDVVVDNPNVGANLQNHYGTSVVFTNATPLPGDVVETFINVSPYMPADDVRRVQMISFNAAPGILAMAAFLMQPRSLGNVTIVSKDPLIPAKLDLNLYSDGGPSDVGSDAYIMVSFLKIAQSIAAAAGETVLVPNPFDYSSDANLFAYLQSLQGVSLTYHGTGTARVSTSSADGVVDGDLHVHGTKNLMVADASVLYPTPSGNTAAGAYVVGLVAADILGRPTPPIL